MTEPGTRGPISIRRATVDDLDGITRVYDTTIVDNHASFDTEPWTRAQREAWWIERQGSERLQTWVAVRHDEVIGVTYSSWFRHKAAYERTVETTIVLDPAETGQGLGTRLYRTLLDHLPATGVHRAYAVIALPNDASVAIHRALGFEENGVQDEVGFKHGRYWSTVTFEKRF